MCLPENAYVEDLVLDVTVFKDGALKGGIKVNEGKRWGPDQTRQVSLEEEKTPGMEDHVRTQ